MLTEEGGGFGALLGGKPGKEKPDLGNHAQDQSCKFSFPFCTTAPVHGLAGTWPGLPWQSAGPLQQRETQRSSQAELIVHKRGNDIFICTNFYRILPNFTQTSKEQLSLFQLLYSYFSRGYYSKNGQEAI